MNNKWSYLLVFLGGGVGSILRFWINKLIVITDPKPLPLSTFTANMVGCLLIGFFFGLFHRHYFNPYLTLLLTTGFCGGLTTFSTFMYENTIFIKDTDFYLAFSYTLVSIFIGFAATLGGIAIAKNI